jgi:formylglycine-generating enzyme required for sulfatase activity
MIPACHRRGCRILSLCLVALLAACASSPGPRGVTLCSDCPETVAIAAGRFIMGTPENDPENWSPAREGPQHEVQFARPFAMGRYEVTRAQFAAFVAAAGEIGGDCLDWNSQTWVPDAKRDWRNPGFAQTDRDPVVCVSWKEAKAYTRWLSAKTGQNWRLPTEAEWEYAARAGTTTRRYWGDSADEGCAHANVADQALKRALGTEPAVNCDDGFVHTAPAGSLRPNAWGLHDMLGNAWEWTEDCWHEGYGGAPEDGSAHIEAGEADCVRRVNRGAGWNSNPRNVRSSNRGNYAGVYRYNIIGFRVVRAASEK